MLISLVSFHYKLSCGVVNDSCACSPLRDRRPQLALVPCCRPECWSLHCSLILRMRASTSHLIFCTICSPYRFIAGRYKCYILLSQVHLPARLPNDHPLVHSMIINPSSFARSFSNSLLPSSGKAPYRSSASSSNNLRGECPLAPVDIRLLCPPSRSILSSENLCSSGMSESR